MKIGDLVLARGVGKEIAIVVKIKELNQHFVNEDGHPRIRPKIITVIFPETNKVHRFPEHYLELISEV